MVLLLLSGILGRGSPRSRAMFFKPFEGIGVGTGKRRAGRRDPHKASHAARREQWGRRRGRSRSRTW